MRLLLSGGSHRATLGAMGAVGYFLWSEETAPPDAGATDRWSDVNEVVSVSGGSILNGTLAAHPSATNGETLGVLADLRRRLAGDGLLPHRTPRRLALTTGLLTVAAVAVWAVLAAGGVVGPDQLASSPWALLVGVTVAPVVIGVARRLVARYQRDVLEVVTDAARPLDTAPGKRRHIMCASGLSSGVPYYFVVGGETPFEPAYGAALSSGYRISDAVAASTALPGLGQVRAPGEFRRELLVDGGVSGGFGEQVATTQIRRRPSDTWRNDGDWFAVDAVRHLQSDSRLGQLARSLSTTLLISRWLKVSLEATYVNDLIDLGPGRYARVWSPNELPASRPPSTAVFRDGSAASDAAGDDRLASPERARLGELQQDVSVMGLFSLNERTVDLGIVVGFVSTLEVRRGLTVARVTEGLDWLDQRLSTGGRLREIWEGPGTSRLGTPRNDDPRGTPRDDDPVNAGSD
ncbi:MAG: hypothetical protein ACE37B_08950 [Ilumatobacter sp.]|uniref:hypothetical protein n=1 Tax=Ilumatobacter sp. TaxID=1967498 RepID=UPI003918EE9C